MEAEIWSGVVEDFFLFDFFEQTRVIVTLYYLRIHASARW